MNMLFDGWESIGRAVLSGGITYVAVVLMLRVSGKRTLAKMNAFDLVVTVALGSTLATIALSKDVSVATGIAALAVLIGLQYAVAWLSLRSEFARKAVRSEPRLLVRRGNFVESAMRSERLTEEEVLSAIRSDGHSRIAEIDAVILETDGAISIVPSVGPSARAMVPVQGREHD